MGMIKRDTHFKAPEKQHIGSPELKTGEKRNRKKSFAKKIDK
jgi:hypothetical protein